MLLASSVSRPPTVAPESLEPNMGLKLVYKNVPQGLYGR